MQDNYTPLLLTSSDKQTRRRSHDVVPFVSTLRYNGSVSTVCKNKYCILVICYVCTSKARAGLRSGKAGSEREGSGSERAGSGIKAKVESVSGKRKVEIGSDSGKREARAERGIERESGSVS